MGLPGLQQVLFGITLLITASMYVLDINGAILIGIISQLSFAGVRR